MKLNVFLHQLQFDPEKTRVGEWETDWDDAPLPYKLYRHLPIYPLCANIPHRLDQVRSELQISLKEIGHFLWYSFGITQLSQSVADAAEDDEWRSPLLHCRRFVPSGGGLYPSELYLYLKQDELPHGIYHYDTAHHRLVLLREGEFDEYVSKSLGRRCDISACFGVAFISTLFWKNYFKYHNFSYRLQGLDAGLLMGQLQEVSKRFQIETGVYYQFLDQAVNHLLGLSDSQESIYAVIPLSAERGICWFGQEDHDKGDELASDLCKELPMLKHEYYNRSQKIMPYPMLLEANEASMLANTHEFHHVSAINRLSVNETVIPLPAAERRIDRFAAACRNRYSPETDFVLQSLSLASLSALVQQAWGETSYRNDLDGLNPNQASRISLYGCFFGVDGLDDGAYRYDECANALHLVRPGDHRPRLQEGLSLANINMFQVSLCFHIVGDIEYCYSQLGYRGYRIQQMETGMLVQRLLLAASAAGLGGRPLLGFDAAVSDDLYGLQRIGLTSLIQIPVGNIRIRSRLEGSLSN